MTSNVVVLHLLTPARSIMVQGSSALPLARPSLLRKRASLRGDTGKLFATRADGIRDTAPRGRVLLCRRGCGGRLVSSPSPWRDLTLEVVQRGWATYRDDHGDV